MSSEKTFSRRSTLDNPPPSVNPKSGCSSMFKLPPSPSCHPAASWPQQPCFPRLTWPWLLGPHLPPVPTPTGAPSRVAGHSGQLSQFLTPPVTPSAPPGTPARPQSAPGGGHEPSGPGPQTRLQQSGLTAQLTP